MANKHMRRCLIREIKIKSTVRYHNIPKRMAERKERKKGKEARERKKGQRKGRNENKEKQTVNAN